jgi:hypothetical protein
MYMEITAGELLRQINSPEDLKKLPREKLHQVCDELRQYIIDVVSVHGGHFGASLGVVELTVALHYILILPTINWFGMWVTRLTGIKFSQAAGIILLRTGSIMVLAVFQKEAKVNTTHLE